ncbi:MAG TPA: hypothetical protein VFV92_14120 [Candidatus Bathyarchaeia archaeon]|nr:hypothetical protein [Candidatus Bathyarchaeia archaeon]
MKRPSVWAGTFSSLLVSFTFLAYGQERPLRFPESRSYSPGQVWLEWTPAERTGFVKGFIVGHGEGYQSGCRVAEANSINSRKTSDELDPCLQQRHLFRKEAPFYEQFITDFYNRYSMDRDVPVRILLLQADEKTPDDVHQWLAKKPQ